MEQVEELEFDDVDQLRLKEAEYQKNNECVNKNKLKTNDEMREYKRIWAEKNRRVKGMQIKTEMNKTKDPKYYNNKAKEYRAKEDDETKAERLRLRREKYKTIPQTEDQKQRARERAKQQRLNKITITINN